MFKNKIITKTLTILLLLSIMMGYMPIGVIKAEASENITLNLISEPEIDIVLTLGNTNLNATNFERDIKNALSNKGINLDNVKITAVDAVEQNIFKGTFKTNIYWDYNGYDMDSHLKFYSNGSLVNELYYGRKQVYGCSLDYDDTRGGTGEWLTLNFDTIPSNIDEMHFEVKAYRGRANTSVRVYREVNGKQEVIINETRTVGNYDKEVVYFGKFERQSDGTWDFVSYSGRRTPGKVIEIISKDFNEVIRQPEWREGSKRFLVNLENNKVADFDNPSASGEILTRLINEEIHYLAVGSNTNKSQAENFIARNNGNGEFFSSSNYNAAIEGIAQYIKNQMTTQSPVGEQYVLIGEPIKVNVNPPHLAKDTQTPEYPQGRWRIDHDYEYFDNNLGQAIWANQWQKDLILTFDKPGKYEIFFEDINPEPRFIYVHRRPVASFSLNITKTGSNYNVSINDFSYDPDREFSSDRGIAEYEWKWRETTATTWNDGMIPSTLPLGKNYIVQLRVKDHQGEWSIPEARYITTDSILTLPVANFNVSPNPVSMYETLTVNDNSYDPCW